MSEGERAFAGKDGLASERVSYFDSMPIALATLTRPRVWPAFLRSRFARPRV